jgi:hypothetical protein
MDYSEQKVAQVLRTVVPLEEVALQWLQPQAAILNFHNDENKELI